MTLMELIPCIIRLTRTRTGFPKNEKENFQIFWIPDSKPLLHRFLCFTKFLHAMSISKQTVKIIICISLHLEKLRLYKFLNLAYRGTLWYLSFSENCTQHHERRRQTRKSVNNREVRSHNCVIGFNIVHRMYLTTNSIRTQFGLNICGVSSLKLTAMMMTFWETHCSIRDVLDLTTLYIMEYLMCRILHPIKFKRTFGTLKTVDQLQRMSGSFGSL